MDMCDKIDAAAIGRVWDRVANTSAPSGPEGLTKALRDFIDRVERARDMYALLALKTKGTALSKELSELAGAEADTGRRLQTEYFLLTGDTCVPGTARASAPYLMGALRDAHAGELENAKAYAALAAAVSEGKLRETLYDLSARERSHAEKLREIVGRMMA